MYRTRIFGPLTRIEGRHPQSHSNTRTNLKSGWDGGGSYGEGGPQGDAFSPLLLARVPKYTGVRKNCELIFDASPRGENGLDGETNARLFGGEKGGRAHLDHLMYVLAPPISADVSCGTGLCVPSSQRRKVGKRDGKCVDGDVHTSSMLISPGNGGSSLLTNSLGTMMWQQVHLGPSPNRSS